MFTALNQHYHQETRSGDGAGVTLLPEGGGANPGCIVAAASALVAGVVRDPAPGVNLGHRHGHVPVSAGHALLLLDDGDAVWGRTTILKMRLLQRMWPNTMTKYAVLSN